MKAMKALTQLKADRMTEKFIKSVRNIDYKQKHIIIEYAYILVQNQPRLFDWYKLNRAIIDRWSLSGLRRIKEVAWKIHARQLYPTYNGQYIIAEYALERRVY